MDPLSPAADGRQRVAIFRHNLFKVSEPFITQQSGQLQRYRALYVGRLRYGEAPAGSEALALQDIGGRWSLPGIARQMITRNPTPYVRRLGAHRPALIHAHFGVDGVYALPLAQRLNIPLVTTFHGFDATLATRHFLYSPAWFNYPLFRHRLARQGSLFLCVSEFIRERVLAMGFPEDRTHVHYIGIDVQATRARDPAEEAPIILHVGRQVEMKGTEYLIRAFADIARHYPDVELVIIGDGTLRKQMQTLARSLGLGARARFLGAQPHATVMRWMRRAAMLVLPSVQTRTGRNEGLGMVFLEAAATGVPMIGSYQGGIPEAIIEGKTGLLVPQRNVEALTAQIKRLLDDRGLREYMGRQARALVEQRFDIRRQTARLEAFYDLVLASEHSASTRIRR